MATKCMGMYITVIPLTQNNIMDARQVVMIAHRQDRMPRIINKSSSQAPNSSA